MQMTAGSDITFAYVTRAPRQPVLSPRADGTAEGRGLLGGALNGQVMLLMQSVGGQQGMMLPCSLGARNMQATLASAFRGKCACVCLQPGLDHQRNPLLQQIADQCVREGIVAQVLDYRQLGLSHAYLATTTGRVFLRRRANSTSSRRILSRPNAKVSSRVANPLGHDEDPHATFCDTRQAKATTATALFRNPELFASIRKVIIPNYLSHNSKVPLCIWSAGCSSGEEAYSLAMTVEDERARLKERFSYRLYGTDINPQRLAEGKRGNYRYIPPSSFQDKRAGECLKAYGSVHDGRWQASDALRNSIQFLRVDLRKRPSAKQFNYIVCNHVLQYYDADAQAAIIRNFFSVLRSGGGLYLEGITPALVEQSGLRPLAGIRNLYEPPR